MLIFKSRFIRYLITLIRLIYFTKIRNNKILKKKSRFNKDGTLERNIKSALSFRDCYSGERSSYFLKKLNKLIKKNKRKTMKILLVGPRNEGEIFNFLSYDFKFKKINAIDLFSYSKKIKVWDMHQIDKIKKKFDLIYFGFILNYSKNINSVILKSNKLLNKNGFVGISIEYDNWISMKQKTKNFYNKRLKNEKFEKLIRIKKKHLYNNHIKKKYKKIFFYTYTESLGFNFDDKKCMSILLKKHEKI
tara:strand:+ start:1236 stop:1976 length:741 start_codon:yes stop_codon:yes gene_type:complete